MSAPHSLLSICATIKDRSRLEIDGRKLFLFPRCVASIREALKDIPGELVVADWGSEDWPLEEWLPDAASPVPVRILQLEGTFSRGRGLNAAARAARGDVLFFADADAIVSAPLIHEGIEHARSGRAYFPIVFAYESPDHSAGRWCEGGFGHCFIAKRAFEEAGGWPEYSSWGQEDKDLWRRISARQPVVREKASGFHHQWHPEDPAWKNRYGEQTPAFEEKRAKVLATQTEVAAAREVFARIEEAIPGRARFILVDEDRFSRPPGAEGRIVPFLERDGRYWGIPASDASALAELERLESAGARYMVFPWITFWWLDHFSGLADHLRSKGEPVLEDERLVIFDLAPGRSAR